jgi:hypothetical protein
MSLRATTNHLLLGLGSLAGLAGAGCTGAPSAPEHPTWADVAPIVRGECAGCHGTTALTTGGGYRLDFFDMTPDVCGDAAPALRAFPLLAAGAAPLIRGDVTAPPTGDRPRMPPAPAPTLVDWERETLQRWTSEPSKGPPPAGNRPPVAHVGLLPATVDRRLSFTVVLEDPDGEPVVGVLQVGGAVYGMDHAGAFSVDLDASAWPAGPTRVRAVLCDGWTNAPYDLGPIQIRHAL